MREYGSDTEMAQSVNRTLMFQYEWSRSFESCKVWKHLHLQIVSEEIHFYKL